MQKTTCTLSWIAATGEEGLADKLANQAVNEKVRMKGKDSEEASTMRDQVGTQYKKCGKNMKLHSITTTRHY